MRLFKARIQNNTELQPYEKGAMKVYVYSDTEYIIVNMCTKVNRKNIDRIYREIKSGEYENPKFLV